MKFICTTEVNQPVTKVVKLFSDINNLKGWQKDLNSYESLSGTAGEAGAVTKLIYKRVVIIETITLANIPFEISGEYEHKRGDKTVMVHKASNRFTSLPENKTLVTMEMETVKFIGFFPKLMMSLMGGVVKKYYQGRLDQFKKFAEQY